MPNKLRYGLLSDTEIRAYSTPDQVRHPMIDPFVWYDSTEKEDGKISYGITAVGYDIRTGPKFQIFSPDEDSQDVVVDPKNFQGYRFLKEVVVDDYIDLPPYSYALSCSVEHFQMPSDIVGICLGKSTYARCAIAVNVTPLEPGWRGYLTIEIANQSKSPVRIYAWEGIAQILFFRTEFSVAMPYDARNGKYMHQVDIVHPRIKGAAEKATPVPYDRDGFDVVSSASGAVAAR